MKTKGPLSLDTVRGRLAIAFLVFAVLGAILFLVLRPLRSTTTVLNVSYDATRELYEELNEAYARSSKPAGPQSGKIEMSHAGSSAQVQALVRGLMADVVTLANAADLDALRRAGLVSGSWRQRFPHGASPYSSTIVFLVRTGNPQRVKDWADLAREDVVTVTPDPRVSGAGRWGYLAAWGSAFKKSGDSAEAATAVWNIYWNADLVSEGARGVLERFERSQDGDVLLTWESEAYYAVDRYGRDRFQVVHPTLSIRAEPVVAVVDRYVDRRGTRAAAEAYLKFLYSREGQEIAARHFLRPRSTDAALPGITLFTVEEVFGSWEAAFEKHFARGGTFDRIVELRQMRRGE